MRYCSYLLFSCQICFGVKLSRDIQHVQKRCLKIIYPTLSYSEALEESDLVRLDTRREEITLLGK